MFEIFYKSLHCFKHKFYVKIMKYAYSRCGIIILKYFSDQVNKRIRVSKFVNNQLHALKKTMMILKMNHA